MSTTKVSTEIKALREAKDAATKLVTYAQALRQQHAALVTERDAHVSAHGSQDEVVANMTRLVDAAAAQWATDYTPTLVRELSGFVEQAGINPVRERHAPPRLPAFPWRWLDLPALCALAPSVVKAQLTLILQAAPAASYGLPAEARASRLADLAEQIAALESQHMELVDGAAEVGIVLPLLDAVRERREQEARRLEREQELAAERAAGIYHVG